MPETPEEPGDSKQNQGRSSQASQDTALRETAILLARISGIGWYVAGSIAAGIGAGWLLDRQFGTEPILLLVGLVLGVLVAFTGMIRLLNAFGRQRSKR